MPRVIRSAIVPPVDAERPAARRTQRWRAERHRAQGAWPRRPDIVPDLFALALLLGAALTVAWPMLGARDLQTFGGDWPAHAFRINEIHRSGIASWSHAWAGGMPLWAGYQAAPHLLTLAMMRLTGMGTARAMVVVAGLMLVALRLSGYAALRWAGARPAAALTGVALATLLDTARQPVANYSELWGLALAPLALAGGYRCAGRPGGFIVAALLGLAVEVHPLLAVTGAISLGAGALARPRGCAWRLLLGQAVLLLFGAAVFWLPLIRSALPAYSEPYYGSAQFARLLYRLAVAGFAPGWEPAMIALLAGAGAAWWRTPSAPAPRFLLLVAGASALLISVSLSGLAPESLRQGQLVRLVSLWPLLAGVAAALLVSGGATGGDVSSSRPHRPGAAGALLTPGSGSAAPVRLRASPVGGVAARSSRFRLPDGIGGRHAWPLALVLLALAAARGWGGPLPALARPSEDGATLASLLVGQGEGRIWAEAALTARLSARSDGALRFAGSYSGREWSILHGPLEFYLAGNGTPRERSAYLVAAGVRFVALPAGERPALGDLAQPGDAPSWSLLGSGEGYDLLRLSVTSPDAWTLPSAQRDGLTAPNARFRDVASSYLRGEAVARFAAASFGPESRAASVRYPDATSLRIDVAGLGGDRYLVVNESWDRAWRAESDGRPLPLARFGPNLIGVDLAGLRGDATVRLVHRWRAAELYGIVLSLVALPLGVVSSVALRSRQAAATEGVGG